MRCNRLLAPRTSFYFGHDHCQKGHQNYSKYKYPAIEKGNIMPLVTGVKASPRRSAHQIENQGLSVLRFARLLVSAVQSLQQTHSSSSSISGYWAGASPTTA